MNNFQDTVPITQSAAKQSLAFESSLQPLKIDFIVYIQHGFKIASGGYSGDLQYALLFYEILPVPLVK
jgi:hypothetical protein